MFAFIRFSSFVMSSLDKLITIKLFLSSKLLISAQDVSCNYPALGGLSHGGRSDESVGLDVEAEEEGVAADLDHIHISCFHGYT